MSVQDDLLVGHVLHIEHEQVFQQVTKTLLPRFGLTCDVVSDGLEALEALKNFQYDTVLMGSPRPITGGWTYDVTIMCEVSQLIRAREQELGLAHVPILALSRYAQVGEQDKCLDAGMDDYILMPLNVVEFKKLLHKWLPAQESIPELVVKISNFMPIELLEWNHPESKILDMNALGELFEIMGIDALEMLQEYLNHVPELLKYMDKEVQDNNAANLLLQANSLKCSSACVGAMHVSAISKELEFIARENKMDEAPACLKFLQSALAPMEQALQIIIQRGSFYYRYQLRSNATHLPTEKG